MAAPKKNLLTPKDVLVNQRFYRTPISPPKGSLEPSERAFTTTDRVLSNTTDRVPSSTTDKVLSNLSHRPPFQVALLNCPSLRVCGGRKWGGGLAVVLPAFLPVRYSCGFVLYDLLKDKKLSRKNLQKTPLWFMQLPRNDPCPGF